jgi:hypothetical protein
MGVVAYKIKQRGTKKTALILVQSEDAVSNVPRRAGKGNEVISSKDFEDVLEPIKAAAEAMFNALRSSGAEIDLEFGVELGAKFGIPKIVEFGQKANVKVRLKWPGNKAV